MDVNAYAKGTNAAGDSDSANILHGVTGSVFGEVIFHWKILNFLQEVEFEWTAGESRILSDTFQVRAAGVKNFHLELIWKKPWNKGRFWGNTIPTAPKGISNFICQFP